MEQIFLRRNRGGDAVRLTVLTERQDRQSSRMGKNRKTEEWKRERVHDRMSVAGFLHIA